MKKFLAALLFLISTTSYASSISFGSGGGGGGDSFLGVDGQVQFNDGAATPGVDPDFLWTLATNTLLLERLSLDGGPIAGPQTIKAIDDTVNDANQASALVIQASNKTDGSSSGDGGDLDLRSGTASGSGAAGHVFITGNVGLLDPDPDVLLSIGSGNTFGQPDGLGFLKIAQDDATILVGQTFIDIKNDINIGTAGLIAETLRVESGYDITAAVTEVRGMVIVSDVDIPSGNVQKHVALQVNTTKRGSNVLVEQIGIEIAQFFSNDNIFDAYSLKIVAGSGSVPTNYFAIFQEEANADNVFNGDTRFGSTTAPTAGIEVDVTGDIAFTGRLIGLIEEVNGFIEGVVAQTYPQVLKARYTRQVDKIAIFCGTGSGTATVDLKIDGVDITTCSGIAVTDTESDTTCDVGVTNDLAADETLDLVVDVESSCGDLIFSIQTTRD